MRRLTRREWSLALLFSLTFWFAQVVIRVLFTGSYVAWISEAAFMLPLSLLSGFVFVLLMRYLRDRLTGSINVAVHDNEEVIKVAGANHIVSKEGVGGKLVLTDRRLIFVSHKFNVQNHVFETPIDEVLMVEPIRLWKLFNTGLLVELRHGGRHKFVVDDPGDWIAYVRGKRREKVH